MTNANNDRQVKIIVPLPGQHIEMTEAPLNEPQIQVVLHHHREGESCNERCY